MLVRSDGGESFDLIDCALFQFGIVFECLDRNDFHGVTVSMLRCMVHFAIDAFAYLLVQGVVFNYAAHYYYDRIWQRGNINNQEM